MKRLWSALGRGALLLCTVLGVVLLLVILGIVVWHGWGSISWEFLAAPPRKGMTAGGIFPANS